MNEYEHLDTQFLREVSDLLVSAMGDKFQAAIEKETQIQIRTGQDGLIAFIISFSQIPDAGRLIIVHNPAETIGLEFNYVPNAEVKVVSYRRSPDKEPFSTEVLLQIIKWALEKVLK